MDSSRAPERTFAQQDGVNLQATLDLQQSPSEEIAKPTSVSTLVIPCLKNLNRVVSGDLSCFETEVSPALWKDEMGRLRVWAANIGAHQKGQSSLDHRLRDSSHIREQTIRVLGRLQHIIEDIDDALNHSVEHDDFSDSDISGSSDDEDCTEMQSIYQALRDTIDNLFQLSMIIRQPAQHDRLLGTKRSDASFYEHFDRQHVLGKYRQLEEEVVNRLGLAISQRRAVLRYRERHRMKLGQGLNSVLEDEEDGKSAKLSDTVATTFVEVSPAPKDEWESETVASQTSYAATIMNGTEGPTIPSPPKGSEDGAPFECPYCFTVVTIANRSAWARHVFNDLMPYLCVFPRCSTPHRLYESRREWFYHLKNQHHVQDGSDASLNCPLCLDAVPAGKQLERHIGRHLEELALFALPRSAEDDEDPIPSDEGEPTEIMSEANIQPIDRQSQTDFIMNALIQHELQSQGPFTSGWQADVDRKARALNIWNMIITLRLIQPRIDLHSAVQATLSWESKAFTKANAKSEYDLMCEQKINPISETRQRQAEVGAEVQTATDESFSQNQTRVGSDLSNLDLDEYSIPDDENDEQPIPESDFVYNIAEAHESNQRGSSPSPTSHDLIPESPEVQEGQDFSDIINLRHRGVIHPLRFHKNVINDGLLTIGMLRMAAAREVGALDMNDVRLLFKGFLLRLDNVSCRAMQIESDSQVLCVVSEDSLNDIPQPEPSHTSDTHPSESTSRFRTSKTPRNNSPVRGRKDHSLAESGVPPEEEKFEMLSPMEQVQWITEYFDNDVLPACNEFLSRRPIDAEHRQFEHRTLSDRILAKVMLTADDIDVKGDANVRAARKKLIKRAQRTLNDLDHYS